MKRGKPRRQKIEKPPDKTSSGVQNQHRQRTIWRRVLMIAGGVLTIVAGAHLQVCLGSRKAAVEEFKKSLAAQRAANRRYEISLAIILKQYNEFRSYLERPVVTRSGVEQGLNSFVMSLRATDAACNEYYQADDQYIIQKNKINKLFHVSGYPAPPPSKCAAFVATAAELGSLDIDRLTNDTAFRLLIARHEPDEPSYSRLAEKQMAIEQLTTVADTNMDELVRILEQRTSKLHLNLWDCCRIYE
jgi:hypothetical protein